MYIISHISIHCPILFPRPYLHCPMSFSPTPMLPKKKVPQKWTPRRNFTWSCFLVVTYVWHCGALCTGCWYEKCLRPGRKYVPGTRNLVTEVSENRRNNFLRALMGHRIISIHTHLLTLTHTLTHTYTHNHSHTHTHSHSHTHSQTHTHTASTIHIHMYSFTLATFGTDRRVMATHDGNRTMTIDW